MHEAEQLVADWSKRAVADGRECFGGGVGCATVDVPMRVVDGMGGGASLRGGEQNFEASFGFYLREEGSVLAKCEEERLRSGCGSLPDDGDAQTGGGQ